MQPKLRNASILKSGVYLFFGVLLLQDVLSVALLSTGLSFPVSLLFQLKYLIFLILICFAAIHPSTYKRLLDDKHILAVVGAVMLIALLRGGGFGYIIEELRFYLSPVVFYLIGYTARPLSSDRQIGRFVIFVAILFCAIGLLFVLIDRSVLMDYGLRAFIHQRYSDDLGWSGDSYNGMQVNWFYFREDGSVLYRAFGPFMDPLTTAFFGGSLLLFTYEVHRRKLVRYAGLFTILVGIVLCLTLTRAMISGTAFVLLLSKLRKRGVAGIPLWLALVLVALFVGIAVTNFNTLLSSVDPSTAAHLAAYLKFDLATGLFGSPPNPGAPRGAESLYLTIFLELGILVFIAYVVWFTALYRQLLRLYDYPFVRCSLESMFVYLLASFTTEHWFVFTSCSFFWFLVGNVMQNTKQAQNAVAQNQHRLDSLAGGNCMLADGA